jgi:tetratricopeptide (TPR) repeat protein
VGPYVEFGEYDKIIGLFADVTPQHPMYVFGLSADRIFQGDYAGAVELLENAIEDVENPRQMYITLIFGSAMLAGDFDKARRYAELRNPEFAADADPEIAATKVRSLIAYAYILQNLGETQRADALLKVALNVVRTLPRMGMAGHGIRDVQILALQGKTPEALAALRGAIDEGFRGTAASNGWPMAIDPYLASLRGQPGFQAMVGELDDAVTAMQQRVSQAEQTGNWDELRALTEII